MGMLVRVEKVIHFLWSHIFDVFIRYAEFLGDLKHITDRAFGHMTASRNIVL
jgi:hypothetical protein